MVTFEADLPGPTPAAAAKSAPELRISTFRPSLPTLVLLGGFLLAFSMGGILIFEAAEAWQRDGAFKEVVVELTSAVMLPLIIALSAVFLASSMRRQRRLLVDATQSEQRLRDFAESASDWFWEAGPDLRFRYFSSRRDAMMGESARRHIGRTQEELLAESAAENPGADFTWLIEARKARQPFHNLEYWRRAGDGSLRYISINGTPVFGDGGKFLGYRGTARDLTAQKTAEQEVKNLLAQARLSEARFRDFAENASDWLWEMDSQFRFTYLSPRRAQLTGDANESAIGRTQFEIMTDEERALSSTDWAAFRNTLESHQPFAELGSGLIDQSQKMTVAAMQIADMKVWAHRS